MHFVCLSFMLLLYKNCHTVIIETYAKGVTLSSSLGWTAIYLKILCFLIYITLSSSLGWTTIYINILCLLIYITLSSSLGWTTIYINILCLLIYITLSSSLGWTNGVNNIIKRQPYPLWVRLALETLINSNLFLVEHR